MKNRLDHIVIGASTLSRGKAFVRKKLGVKIPFGGIHDKMGTHNHLMQLGNDTFLEVIAVNPQAEPPGTPRWFALDDPYVRQALEKSPCLLGWVVNTPDIRTFLIQADFPFGKAETISRGSLTWEFGLPEDGRLHAGGMLPYVIQWHADTHPSRRMADLGCRLRELVIHHPRPDWIKKRLNASYIDHLVTLKPVHGDELPRLSAHITTPLGETVLTSLFPDE